MKEQIQKKVRENLEEARLEFPRRIFDPKKIDQAIESLKLEFSKIDKVDPSSPRILKVREVLLQLDDISLHKIIDADIKFLKIMAATELRRRGS